MRISRYIFIIFSFAMAACQKAPVVYEEQVQAFGTLVNIVIVGHAEKQARNMTWYIAKDLRRLHEAWHPWQPGPLGRINKLLPLGARFAYPPSTFTLIEQGMQLNKISNGLFNPAMGELIKLWGFHQDLDPQQQPPSPDAIKTWLDNKISMEDLDVDGIYLSSRNAHVLLDFGAFAKGLAVDMSIDSLKRLGVKNAIVNAGGDLRAMGKKGSRPWRVGIKHPRKNTVMGLIEIQGDESVFTSGDYERYFIHEGKRYHHILDPRTGYPAMDFISVTVIHDNGVTADAAATALFVAGEKDWRDIAKKMGIKYVMIVNKNKQIYLSVDMEKRIQFAPQLDLSVAANQ